MGFTLASVQVIVKEIKTKRFAKRCPRLQASLPGGRLTSKKCWAQLGLRILDIMLLSSSL